MKLVQKLVPVVVLVSLLVLLLCPSMARADTVVTFPDPNLNARIREVIGKPTGDIYASDLVGLTTLDASSCRIADLTGLEYCTNLTQLYLGSNQIGNISSLSGLTKLTQLSLNSNQIGNISYLSGLTQKLTQLYLGSNQIGNISSLSGLTKLTQLSLNSNQISNISSLSGLTNLTYLDLGSNQISDISALSGLTTNLTVLHLNSNQIGNISYLSGLTQKLTQLYLGSNQIGNISSLSGLTNLTVLDLGSNQISDISALSGLTNNLTSLSLQANQIGNISYLSGLTNLTVLWLGMNQISDISYLSGLTKLTLLNLQLNQIGNISYLSGLTNLTWLYLDSNQISNIEPLVDNSDAGGLGSGDWVGLNSNLLSPMSLVTYIPLLQSRGATVNFIDPVVYFPDVNLKAAIRAAISKQIGGIYASDLVGLIHLDASSRGIGNLTGLEYCTNLTYLDLRSNQIGNISSLSGLTNLTYLYLGWNQIGNISSLSGLTNLTYLGLGSNQIGNISSLSGLTKLTYLDLGSNQISDLSSLSGLTNLTYLYLQGNQISNISSLSGPTKLTYLYLGSNQIGNISSLSGLTKLTQLSLNSNQISNISSLSDLTKLTYLYLGSNQIGNILPLSRLTNLTYLDLGSNQISNITPLEGLTNLTSLGLMDNQIADIQALVANSDAGGLGSEDLVDLTMNPLSPMSLNTYIPLLQSRGVTVLFTDPVVVFPDQKLRAAIREAISKTDGDIHASDLVSLTELYASSRGIRDLTGLEYCTNLTRLNLDHNELVDISPISPLTRLSYLSMEYNQINDIGALLDYRILTELYLGHNEISDVRVIGRLGSLDTLVLSYNQVSDSYMTYLQNLKYVRFLYLDHNKISNLDALQGLAYLNQLYLNSNEISNIQPLVLNTGLGAGDLVDLRSNTLSYNSTHTYIPQLRARGVRVYPESPVADAGGPYKANEGSSVHLDASGSYDPDGTVILYEWDINEDGVYELSSSSPYADYAWGHEFQGYAMLRVTDADDLTGTDAAEVLIANLPPLVEAGPDQLAVSWRQAVSFAGEFRDPGWLDTHTIHWDFGDKSFVDGTLNPTHTYALWGTYKVKLTVTDDAGAATSDTLKVIVKAHQTYTLKCPADMSVTDPDGLTISKQLNQIEGATYADLDVDGDGDIDHVIDIPAAKVGDYTVTVVPEPGASPTDTYTLAVSIDDQSTILAENVEIVNIPSQAYVVALTQDGATKVAPVANANGPYVGTEGSPIPFTPNGSYDPDGTIAQYEWNFGDGSTGTGASPTHAYGDNGVYTVTLTVTDNDGLTSTDTATVTVSNVPLTVEAGSDQKVEVFNTVSFSGSFYDPGILDTHTINWDFGDGTGTAGSLTPTHVYNMVGNYTATLKVTDKDGGVGTDTLNVEVIQKYAIWGNSTDTKAILWSGSGAKIKGNVNSNGGISMSGSNNAIDGILYYALKPAISGVNDTFTSSQIISPRPMPVSFALADYQPGGKEAVKAQNAGKYHLVNGNFNVSTSGTVLDGLYYVKGNVALSASNIKGTFTIVAEGTISISGSGMNCTAYSSGLLFFSNGASFGISGSNGSLGGIIYVPKGQITVSGSGNKINGSLFGDKVTISGSNMVITAK